MNKITIVSAILFFFLFHDREIYAQNIAINTTGAAANAAALLDLNTGNTFTSPNGKGIFVPNVALTGTGDATTVASPPASLLVYNTATAGASPNNVVPGFYYWNGTKWIAFSGTGGRDWSLLGNAGTVDGTNFLGTTDDIPFNFRVNNQKAGRIDNPASATFNTFLGYQSGNANTSSGLYNTFMGYLAGSSNTSADSNTFVGSYAGKSNTTGEWNTAVGAGALQLNTIAHNNTAVGEEALYNNTTGQANTAVGPLTLHRNSTQEKNTAVGSFALFVSTASYNTAIGCETLIKNTTGTNNTALGIASLYNNLADDNNTALGAAVMYEHNSGGNNTGVGSGAMYGHFVGSNNTGIGTRALRNSTGCSNNNALGYEALFNSQFAGENVAVGNLALYSQGIGFDNTLTAWSTYNTAVGNEALYSNKPTTTSEGILNTAVGFQSLYLNSTGYYNTALGADAMRTNTTGYLNTAIGWYSLFGNTTGTYNTATGVDALRSNTTASQNTATGASALYANTVGTFNAAMGVNSLRFNTAAGYNIAIGNEALYSMSYNPGSAWASDNVAIGYQALYSNQPTASTEGIKNTAIGNVSLRANTSGAYNTASGYEALNANTTGNYNTAAGYRSLKSNLTGGTNVSFGTFSLQSNTSGSGNVGVGNSAMGLNQTGNNNTGVGESALYDNVAGSQNTAIGQFAGRQVLGSGNVMLGWKAGYSETGSNKLYIANNMGTPLIYGDFSTGLTGLGTITPQSKLSVNGGVAIGTYAGANAAPSNGLIVSGYVGMGIASPGAPLDLTTSGDYKYTAYVHGSNPSVAIHNTNDAITTGLYRIYSSGNSLNIQQNTAAAGDFSTVNYLMTLQNGGNVGIGTSGPGAKLDVNNGAVKFSAAGVSAPSQSAVSAGSKLVLYDGNLNHEIGLEGGGMWFKADGQFTFYDNTGPTARMRIQAGGNVGIGTTAPATKLEVVGTIRGTVVQATTAGAGAFQYNTTTNMAVPDYVFDKHFDGCSDENPQYKMLGMQELKKFIAKERHLPRVPSRQQIEQDGVINTQALSMVTLEKTEELTLYILQLENKSNVQQVIIDNQKKQNEEQNQSIQLLKEEINKIKTQLSSHASK